VRKITPQVQRQMMAMYFTQMILTVLMGFVLAVMFKSLGITSLIVAYAVGIFFWLGIAIPVQMGSTMWDGKPIALFLINTGNTIVSIFIMTTVLTLWQ
jgi:hypothetical protein